jgi:membrane fusion protein, heavy metal efflux system
MKTVILFCSLTIAIVFAGCSGGSPSGDQAQSAANPAAPPNPNEQYVARDAAGIQTMSVQQIGIPDYLELPAHIESDPTRVVHVYPPAGGRIIEMKVRPWDQVQKGQTLATIESGDLSRAVADYHKAQADYLVKQKQLTRSEDLLAHHAIAQKDYEQAQADAQSAQAEVDAAREQIRVFGMDPDHASTELRVAAPRSGVLLDVGASPGEYSTALAAPQPLCTIADLTTVWAVGDIYESDLAAAKLGEQAQVTLNAYPDQKWQGKVSSVSDALDPNTRTLHVRVVLANPGTRLKPAMFGSIRILRLSRQGILVPATAVLREGNTSYVFVGEGQSGGQTRYVRRNVTLGHATDGIVEITSGLKSGDLIVSQGALLLRAASAS